MLTYKLSQILLLSLILFLMFPVVSTVKAGVPATEGDKTFEIGVSPFSGSPVSFDHFRFRSFVQDGFSIRLNGTVTYATDRVEDVYESLLDLQFAFGFERHFLTGNFFSAYNGLEVPFRYRNTWLDFDGRRDKNIDGEGFFDVGLQYFIGLDVFFTNNLYAGFEVGYGLLYRKYLDMEINEQEIEVDESLFVVGAYAFPDFRLGIRF